MIIKCVNQFILEKSKITLFQPGNAIGKNPNLVMIHESVNTQIWLPSKVMNEWINNPDLPGPLRVTVKDAAKFQIKKTIPIPVTIPLMPLGIENQWFYLTKEVFDAFLLTLGYDPATVDYPE